MTSIRNPQNALQVGDVVVQYGCVFRLVNCVKSTLQSWFETEFVERHTDELPDEWLYDWTIQDNEFTRRQRIEE